MCTKTKKRSAILAALALVVALSLLSPGGEKAHAAGTNAMRSVIMVSVRDDSDLPVAYRWLYKHHVPDSISQFAPYVTKYATYRALPLPKNAENFGSYNWIMTEHYWLLNPFNNSGTGMPNGLAFTEHFDKEYLEATCQPTDGDLRPHTWQGTQNGFHPTVFAFIPMFWEEDFKGQGRTIEHGANFRWLITFKYPDGVSLEQGDAWFKDVLVPAVVARPEVNRFLSSRVLAEPQTGPFQRVAEIWFNNSKEWEKAISELEKIVAKPQWAEHASFPYMEPYKDFTSVFLMDHPESDHLRQYSGYITTR